MTGNKKISAAESSSWQKQQTQLRDHIGSILLCSSFAQPKVLVQNVDWDNRMVELLLRIRRLGGQNSRSLILLANPKSYKTWLYPLRIVQHVRAWQMSSRQIAA